MPHDKPKKHGMAKIAKPHSARGLATKPDPQKRNIGQIIGQNVMIRDRLPRKKR